MNPADAQRAIDATRTDLTAIAGGLALTLARLDDMGGGYPATASGANPGGSGSGRTIVDPAHPDDPVPVTGVEAAVFAGTDRRAEADLDDLLRAIGTVCMCSVHARRLVTGDTLGAVSVIVTAANAHRAVDSAGVNVDVIDAQHATSANRRCALYLAQLDELVRASERAARIVGRYTAGTVAGRPQRPAEDVWCANPAHGHSLQPRGDDGSRWCGWCASVRRDYGRLPVPALCDRHDRGERIADNDYRRALGTTQPRKGTAA